METLSRGTGLIQDWIPSVEWLKLRSAADEIQSKEEMRSCGCGVKLDLQELVYPALEEVARKLDLGHVAGFGSRTDAHVHPGRLKEAKRLVVPSAELGRRRQEIAEAIDAFGADTVIELFTTSKDYYSDPAAAKREFAALLLEKARMLEAAGFRLAQRKGPASRLHFGKGHSVLAGGDLFVLDLLRHEAARGYSVSNNDTIITADSMLQHCSLISVFTALNNALNDLYLLGVTDDLTVFPVYDGTPEEVAELQEGIGAYAAFHAERGARIEIADRGPLGRGIKVIGATVVGSAFHELPGLDGLHPGQEILATRHLGDLSLLSMHRNLHFPHRPHPKLDESRWRVLQHFCTSNFLLAKVIQKFLPALGEPLDPAKHVTFATDASGPGLFVLEEGANKSKVDLYLEKLHFIDESSLKFFRKNHTSSTNGPLLLAAVPEVLADVENELRRLGLTELWRVGRVLRKSAVPVIYINPELERTHRSSDARTDLFAPEVHFGEAGNLQKVRRPIFQSYSFSSPS